MGWWEEDKEEIVGKPASEDNEPVGDGVEVVEEVVEEKPKKKAKNKAVKKVEVSKAVKCPNCKHNLVDNGKGFCKICGRKI